MVDVPTKEWRRRELKHEEVVLPYPAQTLRSNHGFTGKYGFSCVGRKQ